MASDSLGTAAVLGGLALAGVAASDKDLSSIIDGAKGAGENSGGGQSDGGSTPDQPPQSGGTTTPPTGGGSSGGGSSGGGSSGGGNGPAPDWQAGDTLDDPTRDTGGGGSSGGGGGGSSEPQPKPNVMVRWLHFDSDKLQHGKSASVQVRLKNTGDARGSKTVNVRMNGQTIGTVSATLAPGQTATRRVSFTAPATGSSATFSAGGHSTSKNLTDAYTGPNFDMDGDGTAHGNETQYAPGQPGSTDKDAPSSDPDLDGVPNSEDFLDANPNVQSATGDPDGDGVINRLDDYMFRKAFN